MGGWGDLGVALIFMGALYHLLKYDIETNIGIMTSCFEVNPSWHERKICKHISVSGFVFRVCW